MAIYNNGNFYLIKYLMHSFGEYAATVSENPKCIEIHGL